MLILMGIRPSPRGVRLHLIMLMAREIPDFPFMNNMMVAHRGLHLDMVSRTVSPELQWMHRRGLVRRYCPLSSELLKFVLILLAGVLSLRYNFCFCSTYVRRYLKNFYVLDIGFGT